MYAQAVPAGIGTVVEGYTGPGWDEWLPPPVQPHPEDGWYRPWRAVFVCAQGITMKGSPRNGQEYVDPQLVLTGAEYEAITFVDLRQRIGEALERATGASSHGD